MRCGEATGQYSLCEYFINARDEMSPYVRATAARSAPIEVESCDAVRRAVNRNTTDSMANRSKTLVDLIIATSSTSERSDQYQKPLLGALVAPRMDIATAIYRGG